MEKQKDILYIPVSFGELVDKITILKIKLNEIKDEKKIKNILKEYNLLTSLSEYTNIQKKIKTQYEELLKINYRLWTLEEEIRRYEKDHSFGDNFVNAARDIYKSNDKRSQIKKEINIVCNSELIEEKSHKE